MSAGPAPVEDPLRREVAGLRKQMEDLRRLLWRCGAPSQRWLSRQDGLTEVASTLKDVDLDPELAEEVLACVDARLAGDPLLGSGARTEPEPAEGTNRGRLWNALTAELQNRFTVDPTLGRPEARPGVVAVVGPPGAGKTTTLIKLAVRFGLADRRPVQLLSTDTYRVAAASQLQTYAGILGVGFQVVETARSMEQALEEHSRKDLILIDSPGFGTTEMEHARDLARLFTAQPEIDVHLVLAATARSADLLRAVDRYELFAPSKLLFTRLDETSALGPVLSAAFRTGKPVSFLAHGQQIPEDLEAASKERLIDQLFENRWNEALAAV